MRKSRVVALLIVVALVGAACTSHKAVNSGGGGPTPTVPPTVKLVERLQGFVPRGRHLDVSRSRQRVHDLGHSSRPVRGCGSRH